MRRRTTHILALLWAVTLFGVVLPGHRPGAVPLPGVAVGDTGSVVKAMCPLCVAFGLPLPGGGDDGDPVDGSAGCALCHLKSQLDAPPPAVVVAFGLDRDLGELAPATLSALVPQRDGHGVRPGRAPPATA